MRVLILLSILCFNTTDCLADDSSKPFASDWVGLDMEETTLLLGVSLGYNLIGSAYPKEYGAIFMLGGPLAGAYTHSINNNHYTTFSAMALLFGFGYYNNKMGDKDLDYEERLNNNMLASAIVLTSLWAIDNLTQHIADKEIRLEPVVIEQNIGISLSYNF